MGMAVTIIYTYKREFQPSFTDMFFSQPTKRTVETNGKLKILIYKSCSL
jgi:hypothetical protein